MYNFCILILQVILLSIINLLIFNFLFLFLLTTNSGFVIDLDIARSMRKKILYLCWKVIKEQIQERWVKLQREEELPPYVSDFLSPWSMRQPRPSRGCDRFVTIVLICHWWSCLRKCMVTFYTPFFFLKKKGSNCTMLPHAKQR